MRASRPTRTAVAMLASAGIVLSSIETVRSAPAVTTAEVNFRSGPGTRHAPIGVLAAGATVEIVACEDATVWCEVFADGRYGFVSGNFLREIALPFEPPPGEALAIPGWEIDAWEEVGFGDDELDRLVAPFALFPDAIVAEILMASTFPFDIVMADRWIAVNTDMPAESREAAAAAEGWDESVIVLAVGFPGIVTEMAADLTFTRDLGDAVLVQPEDVLEAIQRQRRRARAVGNLESNEVQSVEVSNTFITIAPAQPDVVFIPRYDPQVVFTAPAPVIVQQAGVAPGAVALTGAIAFGTGVAVGQTFRRSYWWGPSRVNWTNNVIINRPGWRPPPGPGWRPDPGRPGVGRPPGRPGEIGIWRPDDRLREDARDRIRDRRPGTDRPVAGRPPAIGTRPDLPGVGRPGGTRPDRPDVSRLRPDGVASDRPPGGRPRPDIVRADRPGGLSPGGPAGAPRPDRAALEQGLRSRSGRPDGAIRPPAARPPEARPSRPAAQRPAPARPGTAGTAVERRPAGSRQDAQRAADRARQSASAPARRPAEGRPETRRPQTQRPAQTRPAQRPGQAAPQRPSAPSRAAQQRPAQRATPPQRTAVDRGRQGGRDAAAVRARGAASRNARNPG